MTFEKWCEAQGWDPAHSEQWKACWDAAVAAERERCVLAGGAAADAGMDGAGVAEAIRNQGVKP